MQTLLVNLGRVYSEDVEVRAVPPRDREEDLAEKHAELYAANRSIYLSGAPLFTKDIIRDIYQQLKELDGKTGEVFIKRYDGTTLKYTVATGRVWKRNRLAEYIIGRPFLQFETIQHLTMPTHYILPRAGYCALRVHHETFMRDPTTKEVIDHPEVEGEYHLPSRLSLDECRSIFQSKRHQWEESEACKQMKLILQSLHLEPVRQIIAFACGTLTSIEPTDSRTSYQHALILTLRDLLSQGKDIPCYAQDPIYSKSDESLLSEHGITVLHNPEAFLQVDDHTFILSCGPMVPVKQIVAELARPAAMIWNRVVEGDYGGLNGRPCCDADSSRVRDMISNSYDLLEYPNDVEHFGNAVLYTRRSLSTTQNVHHQS